MAWVALGPAVLAHLAQLSVGIGGVLSPGGCNSSPGVGASSGSPGVSPPAEADPSDSEEVNSIGHSLLSRCSPY